MVFFNLVLRRPAQTGPAAVRIICVATQARLVTTDASTIAMPRLNVSHMLQQIHKNVHSMFAVPSSDFAVRLRSSVSGLTRRILYTLRVIQNMAVAEASTDLAVKKIAPLRKLSATRRAGLTHAHARKSPRRT